MSLSKIVLPARLFAIILILTAISFTSCNVFNPKNKTKVAVRPLFEKADIESLKEEVNRFADAKSLSSKIYIKFEDNTFAESGIAEKYKTADGEIIVQRPANIYFAVKVPFVGTDIAQMTSNGNEFCVAVLYGVDEKYKKFVCGSNNADYTKLRDKISQQNGDSTTEKRAISAFASLRPQHFTESLLMSPIKIKDDGFIYVQSEFEQEETDTSTQKGGAASRLIRGYYFLDELKVGEDGNAKIMRRFWFNRVVKVNLARQQVFDNDGQLITDIVYGAEGKIGENGELTMPLKVTVTRPQEKYKVTLEYKSPQLVKVGKDYDAKTFNLVNRWNLPEVDLDKQKPE